MYGPASTLESSGTPLRRLARPKGHESNSIDAGLLEKNESLVALQMRAFDPSSATYNETIWKMGADEPEIS